MLFWSSYFAWNDVKTIERASVSGVKNETSLVDGEKTDRDVCVCVRRSLWFQTIEKRHLQK